MAKKARKAKPKTALGGPDRKIGHLIVRFQGRYYFIPSNKIGEPLTDDGLNNLDELEKEVAETLKKFPKGLVGLEFAMEISDSVAAAGAVAKGRN